MSKLLRYLQELGRKCRFDGSFNNPPGICNNGGTYSEYYSVRGFHWYSHNNRQPSKAKTQVIYSTNDNQKRVNK